MAMLEPTVRIISAFSAMLQVEELIFTSIGVLLGVALLRSLSLFAASHVKLIRLIERIAFFLQRLDIYTEIPLTNELTELQEKIMAQLLSTPDFRPKR
jgi:hypothetical protein